MKNNIKEKKLELTLKYSNANPDFKAGEKLVFYFLAAMVFSRALNAILQIIYLTMNHVTLSGFNIFTLISQILISLLYASLIYGGVKPMIYLALLGGISSLFTVCTGDSITYLSTGDLYFRILTFILLAAIVIQIFVTIFLLINKKTSHYLEAKTSIGKELSAWIKETGLS